MKSNSPVRHSALISLGTMLAAAVLSAPAFAQQGAGLYMGAAVGHSKTNNDTAPFTAIGATVTKSDETNTAFRIFGGYQLTKHFGIEASYVDLGAFGVSGTIGGTGFAATGDVNGGTLTGTATLPLGQKLSVLGNLGLFYSRVKATASVAAVAGRARDHDSDLTAGIGLKYDLSPNVAARLEATHYGLGDNGNAKLYSLGLQYKF